MRHTQEVLGEILRGARERQDMTQAKLAAKCGLVAAYIGAIETARYNDVGFAKVWQICSALGVRASDIVAEFEKRIGVEGSK